MAAWMRLEEALKRSRTPFPKPWQQLHEYSGLGNIGAELSFGTVPMQCGDEVKNVDARIIIFHVQKDVVGPVLTYWYGLWHKNYGYVEFDIRWIWKFLGETEPDCWNEYEKPNYKKYILNILGLVREALQRIPLEQRNEVVERIGTGKFLTEAEAF